MAASGSGNGVLERVKILEVAGVFRRRDVLDAAADALLLSGCGRADIDMVAGRDARERFGVRVPVEELPDVPGAPRRPLIGREDLIEVLALVLGILIFFGAAAAAAVVIASGGSPLWTGAAAVVGAAAAGGVGVLIARALGRRQARELEAQTAAGDLVLCVRVRSPEDEKKAQEILLGHGAGAVRPHEIEIEKRLEDLPLHSLRAAQALVPPEPIYDDDEEFWEWYQPDEVTRWEDVVEAPAMTPEEMAAADEQLTRTPDPRAREVFLLYELHRVPLSETAFAVGLSVTETARLLEEARRDLGVAADRKLP